MLSLLGFGAFALTSLVIGLRLALLARRTRQLPEAAMAAAFLGAGAIGNTFNVLASLGVGGEAAYVLLTAIGRAAGVAGALALYGFTWRVFRPTGRLAAMAFGAGVTIQLYTWLGHAWTFGLGAPLTSLAWWWPTLTSRAAAYLWASAEAIHYWRRMQRRRELGLADALTTQRFLLWGLGAGAAFGIFVVVMVRTSLTGQITPSQLTRDVASLLGLVAAVCIWTAFFPPAAYRSWLEGKGSGAISSAS